MSVDQPMYHVSGKYLDFISHVSHKLSGNTFRALVLHLGSGPVRCRDCLSSSRCLPPSARTSLASQHIAKEKRSMYSTRHESSCFIFNHCVGDITYSHLVGLSSGKGISKDLPHPARISARSTDGCITGPVVKHQARSQCITAWRVFWHALAEGPL